jgi:hypothetical protein
VLELLPTGYLRTRLKLIVCDPLLILSVHHYNSLASDQINIFADLSVYAVGSSFLGTGGRLRDKL